MHFLNYKGKSYTVPSAWVECTTAQAAAAALLYVNDGALERIALLNAMVGKKGSKLAKALDFEQVVELTQWAIDKTPDHFSDQILHRGKAYLLPEEDLSDVVLIEFMEADNAFLEFQKSRANADLLKFLSHLVRPSKPDEAMLDTDWDGIKREKYNSALAPRRAIELSGISAGHAAMVIIRWLHGKQKLAEQFPKLFKSTDEGTGRGMTMLEVSFHISKSGAFGDWDRTLFTDIYKVFAGLEFDRRGNGK